MCVCMCGAGSRRGSSLSLPSHCGGISFPLGWEQTRETPGVSELPSLPVDLVVEASGLGHGEPLSAPSSGSRSASSSVPTSVFECWGKVLVRSVV